MSIYRHALLISCLIATPSIFAATSINAIHSCLALVEFVSSKVVNAKIYTDSEKGIIQKGLLEYGNYLDHDIINPKLLKLYGGNEAQANLMKKLFTRQQNSFVKYLDDRYAEPKIPTDYKVAIQECSIKTGTQGDTVLSLKRALDTMAK